MAADAIRLGFGPADAGPDASARKEDDQKAAEIAPLLDEVARFAEKRVAEPFHLVDACAGKSALGVIAAALLLAKARTGPWCVTAIERESARR